VVFRGTATDNELRVTSHDHDPAFLTIMTQGAEAEGFIAQLCYPWSM
jgi:hypothetical protein